MHKSEYFEYLRDRGMTEDEAIAQMAQQYGRRRPEEIEDLRRQVVPRTPSDEKVTANSMFDTYLAHRREGAAPKAAAQLTAAAYGHTDSEEVRLIAVKLRALEQRDGTPTDTGQFTRTEAA